VRTEAPAPAPASTREQILRAAEEIVNERGLRGATTRVVAERAGCAEGTIFRYFPDRTHLFMEIVKGRYPEFCNLAEALPDRVGLGTVSGNLEELARSSLVFYRALVPVAAGTISERELLEAQRRHFEEDRTGPMRILRSVSAYVRGEQRIGRVAMGVSADHVARMLLGACFSQAFIEQLVGDAARLGSDDHFARQVVRAATRGILAKAEPEPDLEAATSITGGARAPGTAEPRRRTPRAAP
jgi:AcrR family transcriptional regulator